MSIYFIITVIVYVKLESVEMALPVIRISSSLSETLSSPEDIFSELSESFIVIGAGSMLVLSEKWCWIYLTFSDFFFAIFCGVVVKVFSQVIMSENP